MKISSQKMIRLFEPHIGKKELTETTNILKSKFWASGAGIGKVAEFEKKFSKFVGGKHTIAVNSGTAALHLAVSALNVQSKEILKVLEKKFSLKINFKELDKEIEDLENEIEKKTQDIGKQNALQKISTKLKGGEQNYIG